MRHRSEELRRGRVDPEGPRSGMTIVEMLAYTVLWGILAVPLVSAVLVSTRAMSEGDVFIRLAERNRVVLSRVAQGVRGAISGSLVVGDNGLSLSLTVAAGVDGKNPLPGDTFRFEFVPSGGESVDSKDNDGDGLTDEGQLRWQNVTTGESVVLSSEVSLAESGFTLNGAAVTVTVTTAASLENGEPYLVSKSLTVQPRN